VSADRKRQADGVAAKSSVALIKTRAAQLTMFCFEPAFGLPLLHSKNGWSVQPFAVLGAMVVRTWFRHFF